MSEKISVGLTMAIVESQTQNIWSNGANQNCFFLFKLLQNLDCVRDVFILSNLKFNDFPDGMMADNFKNSIFHIDEKIEDIDLLIEMTAYLGSEHVEILRSRGKKIVSYRIGSDYPMAVESTIFNAHEGWIPHPSQKNYDEVWTNAQHMKISSSFVKFLYRCPVYCLPHIWDPMFVDDYSKNLAPNEKQWGHKELSDKFCINIFEPNINVVKSSIIPFCAASKFYDLYPENVKKIHMMNTIKISENEVFKRLVLSTNAGADGTASAEPRSSIVDILRNFGGMVVCHQWENCLNYLYYEVLYGGYPLVHNSPLLKEVGYYYPDFDIESACNAISYAFSNHDSNLNSYLGNVESFLSSVDPMSPDVLKAYGDRISHIF